MKKNLFYIWGIVWVIAILVVTNYLMMITVSPWSDIIMTQGLMFFIMVGGLAFIWRYS